jgi:hypothetical protein
MAFTNHLSAALLMFGAFSCAGSQQTGIEDLPPPPESITRATLSGPLCRPNRCTCVEQGNDPEQAAPEGFKRYEVRLGPANNELWASLDDMVFYKTNERAVECFYVDLGPGKHSVTLRARKEDGLGSRISIREKSAHGGWYDTFEFACGAPGACSKQQLAAFRERVDGIKDNVHDPCGSTKVRKVRWQTGRLPDRRHPADLQLTLELDVYKFKPEHAPGSSACDKSE